MLSMTIGQAQSLIVELPKPMAALESQLSTMVSKVNHLSKQQGLNGWPFAASESSSISNLSSAAKLVWANPKVLWKEINGRWDALVLIQRASNDKKMTLVWVQDAFGSLKLHVSRWSVSEPAMLSWETPSDEIRQNPEEHDFKRIWAWQGSEKVFQLWLPGWCLGFHPTIGPMDKLSAIAKDNETVEDLEACGWAMSKKDLPKLILKERSEFWVVYSYQGHSVLADLRELRYWSKTFNLSFPGINK
jgi:hypothetical protein